jgi:hypothetical protein
MELGLVLTAIAAGVSGCKQSEATPVQSQSNQSMSQPLAASATSQAVVTPAETSKP